MAMSFDDKFNQNVSVQSWTMYAVGLAFAGLRWYASIRRLGWRNLRIDDILMVPALALYTGLIVGLNAVCQGGGSIPYPVDIDGQLSEKEIKQRIKGSQIVLVNEQCLLNLLYILKSCMLVVYTRLTLGLNMQRLVRVLAVYVALCWTATQIVFFTHCRPFSAMWAYPPPNRGCVTLERYELAEGLLNITSDVLILCVPLPLVVRVRMPWRQKAMLFVVLSTGLFVIVAALLNKILDLSNDWNPSYIFWYIRETSVAVYVANMPIIWPLLLQWCPRLMQGTKMSGQSSKPVCCPALYALPAFAGGDGCGGGGGGGNSDGDENRGRNAEDWELSRNQTTRHGSDEESAIDIFAALQASGQDSSSPPVDRIVLANLSTEFVATPPLASDTTTIELSVGNQGAATTDGTRATVSWEARQYTIGSSTNADKKLFRDAP